MILRPATPLTILLLGAFVLLLLSVLSTPIVKSIPLGTYKGTDFGVFGFCRADGSCSSIGIGYDTTNLPNYDSSTFDLPASTRKTLSAILVVHPVAALLTLIMFILAGVSHLHSPSHSARYLLIQFIFTVIAFLVSLLAFLIDILLFIPHMAWGTYIVLAATILVAISGVVSFAMRRTLVSRKARKKRIAENAEMSGENFYNREAQTKATAGMATQPPIPMVSGGSGSGNDTLPAFTSFNQSKDDQVSDERIPLTQRSPVERSLNIGPNEMNNVAGGAASFDTTRRSASRDRYGNPTNQPTDEYGAGRGPSFDRMNSRGRGDMRQQPGYRGGRGGAYNGRGGYDGYGAPMRGRGGYGPPGRGAYGPRGGRGGYGPPPRGVYGQGSMRGGRGPPGYGPGSYDQRPSPTEAYDAYGQGPSDSSLAYSNNRSAPGSSGGAYDPYNPDAASLPRAESPPPLGHGELSPSPPEHVMEMDATPAETPSGFGQYGQLRDSDADVAGMVGLQQGRIPGRHDTYTSEISKYSQEDQYVPSRTGWHQGSGANSPRIPSPMNVQNRSDVSQRRTGTPTGPPPQAGNYYEDVDPRFANAPPVVNYPQPPEPMYEDVHATVGGSRSPAGSERSNFTSISQRGVNPHWDPPPPMPHHQGPPRRPVQQRQDMLLNNNPDFQVPGSSPAGGGSRRAGPGMIPGSAYPTGPM